MTDEDEPEVDELPPLIRAMGVDLGRLRDLLEAGGKEPFLRAPIVRPDEKWFPDRWAPDLESVRKVMLRLLAYAGLEHLDAECGVFFGQRNEWLPEVLRHGQGTTHSGAAAVFLGIENNCAYVAVEGKQLDRPEVLVGVLAHEVAHVWRRVRGLEQVGSPDEEEMTDLTTVVLGLGILSANAAYRYESTGTQRGVFAFTEYSHQTTGYIGPIRLGRLLATQCLLRGENPRSIGGLLELTPRTAFDEVFRGMVFEDFLEPLALDADELPEDEAPDTPAPLELKPGRATREIGDLFDEVVDLLGGEGGLLTTPVPFELGLLQTKVRSLGRWGRPHLSGGWTRELALVANEEWGASMLVLVSHQDRHPQAAALGVFGKKRVGSPGRLRDCLLPLFDATDTSSLIPGEAPSFVEHGDTLFLGMPELEFLLKRVIARLDPDSFAADIGDLTQEIPSLTRVHREGRARTGPPPGANLNAGKALKLWWELASDPHTVGDENSTWEIVNSERTDAPST